MNVERVRVGEVLALQRRPVEVEPIKEYEEIGIRSFGRGIFHKDPVSGASLGNKRVFRIEPGDLVISNVFAWEGAIALATEGEAGKIGSHRFMTFVPTAERIDAAWAAWFLRSEPGLDLIGQASPGSAGRNRTLAIERFLSLTIPLPPIDVQRQQAARLDAVADAARRAADRVGSVAGESFAELLPGMVDTVVAGASIDQQSVGEVAVFVSDTVHPGDDPAPAAEFVGLQHIESHTGRCLGSDALGPGPMKGRKFRFRPGDILFGYLRPYLNKVWVADRHGLCSVDQYVLRPRDGVDGSLLAHCLRGRQVLNDAIELTHSLQLPRLRSGLLAGLDVPVVTEVAAGPLVAQLDNLRDQIVRATAMRRRQKDLIGALLPSALNEAFAALS